MSKLYMLNTLRIFNKQKKLMREEVLSCQQTQFRKMLHWVYNNCPFYRELYSQQGIQEDDLDHIDRNNIPPVNKTMIMNNFDQVVSDPQLKRADLELFLSSREQVSNKYKGKYTVMHTSGSSGTVGIFVYGPKDWDFLKAMVMSRIMKTRINPFKRTRVAFIGAIDGRYAGVTLASDAPEIFFDVKKYSINRPVPEIVSELNDFQPEVINGYSSGALILALQQLQGHLHIHPSQVFGSGDALTPLSRKAIKTAFGVEPLDFYAATESICLGIKHSAEQDMHLFDDWHIFEIVNDKDEPVAPGHSGSLILTNLYNYTMPLVRYRMGDKVQYSVSQQGPFLAIHSIDGRQEEALSFPTEHGEERKISPHLLNEFFVPGLRRFQFIQQGAYSLLMKACVEGDQDVIRRDILQRMYEILSEAGLADIVHFNVEFVNDICNDVASGKFKLIQPLKKKKKVLIITVR